MKELGCGPFRGINEHVAVPRGTLEGAASSHRRTAK
jgi:hypothetical protein